MKRFIVSLICILSFAGCSTLRDMTDLNSEQPEEVRAMQVALGASVAFFALNRDEFESTSEALEASLNAADAWLLSYGKGPLNLHPKYTVAGLAHSLLPEDLENQTNELVRWLMFIRIVRNKNGDDMGEDWLNVWLRLQTQFPEP